MPTLSTFLKDPRVSVWPQRRATLRVPRSLPPLPAYIQKSRDRKMQCYCLGYLFKLETNPSRNTPRSFFLTFYWPELQDMPRLEAQGLGKGSETSVLGVGAIGIHPVELRKGSSSVEGHGRPEQGEQIRLLTTRRKQGKPVEEATAVSASSRGLQIACYRALFRSAGERSAWVK